MAYFIFKIPQFGASYDNKRLIFSSLKIPRGNSYFHSPSPDQQTQLWFSCGFKTNLSE